MNISTDTLNELRRHGVKPIVQGWPAPPATIPQKGRAGASTVTKTVRDAPQCPPVPVRTILGGFRSKWESEYASHLTDRLRAREIAWWAYEQITFKLASDHSSYCPDFSIQLADGRFEFHEVKGGYGGRRQAGITKFKVAAEQWTRLGAFVLIEKRDGRFVETKRYERQIEAGND